MSKEPSVRKILHYPIWVHNKAKYLCNQAVDGTIVKMTANPSDVTCRNCRKIMRKKA
jgi:hypothetical protein